MMGCGMPCVQDGGLHQHVVGLRCNADMHWVSYADVIWLLFFLIFDWCVVK
jgi:hypothetical protein